jgi:hypothetical protein
MFQFFVVIFVFLLSMGNSASAWGQPGVDAITSLKRIEAKTHFNISYDDYSEELATTKSKVNLFLEGPDGKNKFELAEAMKKALDHYDFAILVWMRAKKRKDMGLELSQVKLSNKWRPIKKRKEEKEIKELQEEERLMSIGKSPYYLDNGKDSDILEMISARYLNGLIIIQQRTHVDELLPIIWRQASNEVKNATTAFYKQPRDVKKTVLDEEIKENGLVEESGQVTEESPVPRLRKSRRKATKPPLGWSPPVVTKTGGK